MKAYSLIPSGLPAEQAAINAGLAAAGYRVAHNPPKDAGPGDVLVIWNRWNQNDALAERFEWGGGRVIVAENGYTGPGNVALARSQHNGGGRWPEGTPRRWDALGLDLKPWRADGDHILVCPSRGMGSMLMRQPAGWVENTVERLRATTSRQVIVRPHPGNWKARPPKIPIADQLANAWACVIWNSSAGIHALIAGIPVICCAPKWICKAASGDLEHVTCPPMGDRLAVLERMAWAQWTLAEITSGEPFKRLQQC